MAFRQSSRLSETAGFVVSLGEVGVAAGSAEGGVPGWAEAVTNDTLMSTPIPAAHRPIRFMFICVFPVFQGLLGK
jgi:hypothetical protein